jgi:uncharacterized protein (TIGR03000 family)
MGAVGGGYCTTRQCAVPGKTPWSAAPAAAPAYLNVSLPADAKLSIDNRATTSTSASRSFVTPDLPAGQSYIYTLKAEVVRDGKVETITKAVVVKSGQTTSVSLDLPAGAVAAK